MNPLGWPVSSALDDDDDEAAAGAAATLLMLYSIYAARERRNLQRRERRHYLIRRELPPNPRHGTAWQRLWDSQADRAFITTMGFDVSTFRLILEGPNRFGQRWESSAIPRNDVGRYGTPREGRRSLDGAGALGLVLHYMGSAMPDVSLQQIFGLTPSVLARYLEFAQDILQETLHIIPEAAIVFPRNEIDFQSLEDLICARHSLLRGAFGSIDGLSLATQESDDPEIENATYNGWKTDHRTNNVLAFSPRGRFPVSFAVL